MTSFLHRVGLKSYYSPKQIQENALCGMMMLHYFCVRQIVVSRHSSIDSINDVDQYQCPNICYCLISTACFGTFAVELPRASITLHGYHTRTMRRWYWQFWRFVSGNNCWWFHSWDISRPTACYIWRSPKPHRCTISYLTIGWVLQLYYHLIQSLVSLKRARTDLIVTWNRIYGRWWNG